MAKRKSGPIAGPRLVGYARVSTREQHLDMQIADLLAVGVLEENLHVEKVSGVSSRRPKLELALMDARQGDTFIVWKLDRLGRSVLDLYQKVQDMEARGVQFRSVKDQIDTKSVMGRAMFGFLAVIAQMERDMTIERTKAGMAASRKRGRMPGQPRKMTAERIEQARELVRQGWSVVEIAEKFKVADNTIYTYIPSADLEALRSEKS